MTRVERKLRKVLEKALQAVKHGEDIRHDDLMPHMLMDEVVAAFPESTRREQRALFCKAICWVPAECVSGAMEGLAKTFWNARIATLVADAESVAQAAELHRRLLDESPASESVN